jgi:hypothetical protein
MGSLLDTPSGGQSEVLETLHYEGAISAGVQVFRVGPMVSHRWMGDEDTEGSDPTFEADTLTVLAALQTAGFVVAHADATGIVVDLTAAPPETTRVRLTGLGRATARAPRPRPHRING